MMSVDEIIIVLAFVETGTYPGMELTDTLVSEGRYFLPLYVLEAQTIVTML